MMPKRIFFYWENDKLSWMRYMTFYSFRKMNPDWQIDLYYNEKTTSVNNYLGKQAEYKQDFSNYQGPDYFSKLKDLNINLIKWNTEEVEIEKFKDITPSGKSNIFKWHQLYKNGGIYADTDILFFKPIDQLYNQWNKENADVVICQTKHLSIGLMASTPNNDFFKDIFYNTFKFENHTAYQTYGVLNVYNLYENIERSQILLAAKKKYPKLNMFNLPMNVVYHFNHNDLAKCFSDISPNISDFPENAIGYHWYGGSGVAQKFNNKLNHENYMNYYYLFCKLCKKI